MDSWAGSGPGARSLNFNVNSLKFIKNTLFLTQQWFRITNCFYEHQVEVREWLTDRIWSNLPSTHYQIPDLPLRMFLLTGRTSPPSQSAASVSQGQKLRRQNLRLTDLFWRIFNITITLNYSPGTVMRSCDEADVSEGNDTDTCTSYRLNFLLLYVVLFAPKLWTQSQVLTSSVTSWQVKL